MKTCTCFMICTLLLFNLSCRSQNNQQNNKLTDSKTASKNTMQNNLQYTEGTDYMVFERIRIMDNMGFAQPVEASSVLLPKGWNKEGGIQWVYNPNSPSGNGTYSYFKAASPDNKYSLEMLPQIAWNWSSDPQLLQFMQSGNNNSPFAFIAEPMDAEHYLRNVFIHRELNGASVQSVQSNPSVIQEMQQEFMNSRAEIMMYGAADVQLYPSAITARVSWGNGKEGIVMCGITIIETTIMNQYTGAMQKSYTTSAARRIIFKFPSEEKQQAENILAVMMGSIRINTSWKNQMNQFWKEARMNSHIMHIGRLREMDAQTKAMGDAAISKGAQNLKQMDMNLRTWEEGQASQDRMNTNFIKAIREVETYQDATGKIELSSGYNHAWSRGDGTSFILSNSPNFNPGSVLQDQRWTEMKLVK